MSSWQVTQLSESPSGRRQPEHRNTRGLSSSSAGSAASVRRVLSTQATEASPLKEFHMLVHFCSSSWRLESSESRRLNGEGSLHVLLLPHSQLVAEQPLQTARGRTPAITYKSPAQQRAAGGRGPLRMRGAWREGGDRAEAAGFGARCCACSPSPESGWAVVARESDFLPFETQGCWRCGGQFPCWGCSAAYVGGAVSLRKLRAPN